MRVVLVAALTAACCGERVEEVDADPICVLPAEPVGVFQIDPEGPPLVTYVADAPLHVAVDHGCIGCNTGREHGCTIALDGQELTITSELRYDVPPGPCDGSCAYIGTTCTTAGPVPADTYTVRYAGQTATLTVPGEQPAACISPD